MHEVTEATARALSHLVLAAARLAEVCHRGQFRVHRPAAEPAVIQIIDGFLGIFLAAELEIGTLKL